MLRAYKEKKQQHDSTPLFSLLSSWAGTLPYMGPSLPQHERGRTRGAPHRPRRRPPLTFPSSSTITILPLVPFVSERQQRGVGRILPQLLLIGLLDTRPQVPFYKKEMTRC